MCEQCESTGMFRQSHRKKPGAYRASIDEDVVGRDYWAK